MNSYSVMHWYEKYIVVKSVPNTVRKFYIRTIYHGKITWTTDSTYAKQYNYSTAMKHLRNLRNNDPNCEEDF